MRRFVLFCGALCFSLSALLAAQDAVKADPKHYTVISENDQVRILKVHYGPNEKSVMHSHPAGVVVYLTETKVKFHFPGGKSEEAGGKAGGAMYTPAVTHLPENATDKPFDVIVVELKTKAAAKPAAAKTEKKM